MRRTALSVSILSLFFAGAVLGPPGSAQTKTGDIFVGTAYSYPSAYLSSDVPVSVHLPRDYDRSDARYPVLDVLDFGNDFAFAAARGLRVQPGAGSQGSETTPLALRQD
jgi:hypothetical protein